MSSKQIASAALMLCVLAACAAPTPIAPTVVAPTVVVPTIAPAVSTATAVLTVIPPTAAPPATPIVVPPTAAPTIEATKAPAPTPIPYSSGVLYLVTHDSYAIDKKLVATFEAQTGAKVQILKSGDAGAALNKSILTRGNPLGDVFFGVDNTFLSRALQADIFEPYAPAGLDKIPAALRIDASKRLTPIDVGYVNINYDIAALRKANLAAPATLRDLVKPEYKKMLVVQNPATSSPGLAFMLSTIATFGENGSYTWKDYWRDLRKNDVLVSKGWSEAYYESFSGAGGAGSGAYPMVVSYASSPAAEVFYSEGALKTPPTGNLLPPNGAFRQIEFAGLLKGAKNPELARKWLDFMLTDAAQADVYASMAVYPVMPGIKGPVEFEQFAPIPASPADIPADDIAKNRERWIREWTEIVLR